MSQVTNQLVAKGKRFAIPAGGALAAVLATALFFNYTGVHAAANPSSPLDDSSVASLTALDNAMESVAARVSPAVVNVAVTSKETPDHAAMENQGNQSDQQGQMQGLPPGFAQFFGGQGQQMQQPPQIEHGIGSGVIISPDGYIVTNNHVVDGAMQMKVTLNDRRVMNAKLVGVDKLTDLAVIKVDAKDLPSVSWGDSTALHPGQTVLAFGSPFGYFQNSVTRGIVSAINRQNPYSDDARKPGGFIQTDAAINPGNSGGALVNAHGELIGINTFIISNSGSFAGAGFAIPSQIAKSTVDQLIKTGSVHHGYVGISMNDVTPENAAFFHLSDASGAIVAQVTPDSPASHAGLQQGDVISKLNGSKILNGSALQVAVSEITPGTTISLGVLRNGTPQTLSLKVGEFHKNGEVASTGDSSSGQGGKLGLAVDDLTADVRQQLNIPAQVHGVAVEQVRPASPADEAGLAPGDVILEVNRHAIPSADQFVSAVHANPAGKDLLLLVWSKGNASYRVVHPDQAG
ncbi:MAG: Do family serine endopeptidase [Granulicella sp.]